MGLNEQMKKFTELLTSLVPEDKQEKVVAGVQALADQIRDKVHEELKEEHAETAEQIDRLTEQRDDAIRRAQDAEGKLQEERENAASIIEEAKTALIDEHAKLIESLEAKIAEAESEKDEIALRIAEQYEELRVSDRQKIVKKVADYFETKTEAIRQKVEESASLSIDNLKEAAVLNQIVKVIRDHQCLASGDSINDPATEKLQEELAAKAALVRQLEARNTRLSTELEVVREQVNESKTAAPAEPEVEEEPVNENAAPSAPVVEAPKSGSRASELLREAFSSEEDSAVADDDGWLDEETAEKSRENRLRVAESVSGRGIVVDDSDILKETTTPAAEPVKQSDDRYLIDDTTIREARILSGLPVNS